MRGVRSVRALVLASAVAGVIEVDVRPALAVAAVIVVLVFLVLAVADLVLEVRHQRTLGQYLRSWANAYPLFAAFLVTFLGALLGHFFWH